MISQTLRRQFFEYFKKKGHTKVPSSPVIPLDDPTLLFANAGMNQFKDVFLGKSQRDYSRATSTQKCIRVGGKHNDLENVGHTTRHLTFFEMLGNFSFGDYFKKEAIKLAWEVSLEVFGFDPAFLFATVFEEDDESFELWRPYLPEERIVRMGAADNFWTMGDIGPCGPCSELYYDKGAKWGSAKNPAEPGGDARYLEFWNLVFIEFNRDPDGTLTPLAQKSVDTGAGLERLVEIKMGVDSVFETDILRALMANVETIAHTKYSSKNAPAFHVIADHLRTLAFAGAEGAVPSNVDRGYVLRKVLRRAVRYGKQIGLDKPFLAKMLPTLSSLMGEDFPELVATEQKTAAILTQEEENFFRTLRRGGALLTDVIAKAKKSQNIISGDAAFKLKDTYGLPLDEIILLANDADLTVDTKRFDTLEQEAKERSRAARKVEGETVSDTVYKELAANLPPSSFVGYTQCSAQAKVVAILVDNTPVDTLQSGQIGHLLLDTTPFYAEKGGQVGDIGEITTKSGHFQVSDTQNPYQNIISHIGTLSEGLIKVGDTVTAVVNETRREQIAHNHTATHLLHYALQQIIGPHATQAGSVVDAERLRFDFNHLQGLTPEEIWKIEDLVNAKIRENTEVNTYELRFEEVQKKKEIKQFFGEKYGATVRVVDIDFSKELCGGTHAQATGSIGYFRIIKESSVAAGVRRIEAVCGAAAEAFAREDEKAVNSLCVLVKGQRGHVVDRISSLAAENKELSAQLEKMRHDLLVVEVENLFAHIETINAIPTLAHEVPLESKELKIVADIIMNKQKSLVLLLAVKEKERCQLTIRVTKDLVQKGIKAGELMKQIAPLVQGRGGGRPEMAQGGGEAPENIGKALEKLKEILSQLTP